MVSHSPPLWPCFSECGAVCTCSSQTVTPTPERIPRSDWLSHLVLDIIHHSGGETPGGYKYIRLLIATSQSRLSGEKQKCINLGLKKNYYFPVLFGFLSVSYWQVFESQNEYMIKAITASRQVWWSFCLSPLLCNRQEIHWPFISLGEERPVQHWSRIVGSWGLKERILKVF